MTQLTPSDLEHLTEAELLATLGEIYNELARQQQPSSQALASLYNIKTALRRRIQGPKP